MNVNGCDSVQWTEGTSWCLCVYVYACIHVLWIPTWFVSAGGIICLLLFFYLGFLDEITVKEPRGGYEIHIMPKLFPNTTIAVEEIYIFKISIVTY